jgi:hypothetical protein
VDESNVNYEFAVLRSIPHLFIYGSVVAAPWCLDSTGFRLPIERTHAIFTFLKREVKGEESRNKTDLRVGRLTVLGVPKVAFVFI